MHRRTGWALLALLLALGWPAGRPWAAESQLFRETGWRAEGQILDFWRANGGLAVFGLPIAAQAQETTADGRRTLQRFERTRIELHPQHRAPYHLQLGRLGADLLARQNRDWRSERGEQLLDGACRTFAATGRQVCGPFLSFWAAHGLELGDPGIAERESLALFGLPLTPTVFETNSSGDRVITQWFERARFEWHPNNPPAFRVLLGRLGTELTGEPAPLPEIRLRVSPTGQIAQGQAVSVQAELRGATAMRFWLGDVQLGASRQAGGWQALGGIHALQRVGKLSLVVEADLPDGRVASTVGSLDVREAGYPTEQINLPPAVQDRLNNNQAALAEENRRVRAIWAQISPQQLWSGSFLQPAAGRMASNYGARRSYNGAPVTSFHEGVDISNVTGTPIVAPARGRVVLAETGLIARGGAVILDHGLGLHTGYWHLSQVLVPVGAMVEPGQLIGRMGAEGMVTGPHLHWELRIGPTSSDPMPWLERELP